MTVRTFVDRGGTFTDVVTLRAGAPPVVTKVPSDRAVVGELAQGQLVFGTTVATNALLERRGVPTALLVTEGFEDLLHLRHMARPDLFDPDAREAPPLCTHVFGVPGRIDGSGEVIEPLDLSALPDLSAFQAAAVCLLHGPSAPEQERAVAEALARAHPHLTLVCGHEIDPEPGYLGRVETTLVDAAITPVLQAALRRDRIPPGAKAMRSDGTRVLASSLRAPDAVLSGPAGGVLAVAALVRQLGLPGAVGLDMGGTSTDVCLVHGDDLPRRRGDVPVADTFLRRPMLEVETIAAGGGSVLGHDGVRLTVGPGSAGADPGPACYGRGGPATLTDAALMAGLIDPDAFELPLAASEIELPGPADGFLSVAREAMAGAVRRLAAARGVDLRPLSLVSYGGAAGAHAVAVAERLGMDEVVVHPFASVLSAFGQALAEDSESRVHPLWRPLPGAGPTLREVGASLRSALGEGASLTVAVRKAGTDHALDVPWSDDPAALEASWHQAHEQTWGFQRDPGTLEIESVRARISRPPAPLPDLSDVDPWALGDRVVSGPIRLDAATTSLWIPSGWQARRDRGIVRITRVTSRHARPIPAPTRRDPTGVALWTHRLGAVAEQAGERLASLATSVNIRERRDFSIGLFDADGHMVAHAPHIPVHLGAMGLTVRDLLAHEGALDEGQAWLTNAPDAGGSHLPDLTVVTVCDLDGHRMFIASRAHHVDVGGLTPGSMPPRSRRLSDEGLVFRRVPLLAQGRLRADLDGLLRGSRQPDVVRADLEAQLAAHRHAERALRELASGSVLRAWCAHLLDAAADAVLSHLERLPEEGEATGSVDGIPLRLRSLRDGRGLTLDLTGTGGPHPGNLNAPPAVLRAAALYALRVAIRRPLPMNEGLLRPVRWVVPSPSLVDPPPGAAVVGGNVETSQHLVDLLMRAWEVRASGCGTMSNLSLGGDGWSLYETLAGGQGGSAAGRGVSGRQVHMTNTRITDPEILERRLPLRVRRFALRPGSGGPGAHPGGDGLVREVEVLAPASAALLTAGHAGGAPGLAGGGAGAPGRAEIGSADGSWEPWDGTSTALTPGMRVRVWTPGGGGWADPGSLPAD